MQRKNALILALQIVLPVVVLAGGVAAAKVLVDAKKPVQSSPPRSPVRVVLVETVERRALTHEVHTYGTVAPRAETTLVAEVTGRIVEVSESFVTGGNVDDGEVLLRIDPAIYEANEASARAALARAEAALEREKAEADVARREWERFGKGEASPLVLRIPQLAEAQADVDSAAASLERAELDLARTAVRSPYSGRIRTRFVEDGQYVTAGTRVATIYATDFAEVRLPISPNELAFLDLPLAGETQSPPNATRVTLVSRLGGRPHPWPAWISRTEAEVDRRTRSIHAVARVRDPYRSPEGDDRPPLLVGDFVEAVITGRSVEDCAVVPRRAVEDGRVWMVDSDNRLRRREVEVLRLGDQEAWIGKGLQDGERVCITELDIAVEGMKVRVQPATDGEG